MTEKMTLSFQSPIVEETERNLSPGTLERKMEAFKEDEQLMKETTKFVTDVIETAATEASKRKHQTEGNQDVGEGSRLKGGDAIAGWNNRARGFCTRILNALCPCFTNNELFAWAPYRYRYPFTRP